MENESRMIYPPACGINNGTHTLDMIVINLVQLQFHCRRFARKIKLNTTNTPTPPPQFAYKLMLIVLCGKQDFLTTAY